MLTGPGEPADLWKGLSNCLHLCSLQVQGAMAQHDSHTGTHTHTEQEGASSADRPSQTDKFLESRKQCGIHSKNMFWANKCLSASRARCCFIVFTNTHVQCMCYHVHDSNSMFDRGKTNVFISCCRTLLLKCPTFVT